MVIESYSKISSPSLDEMSSYYECSIGRSITPTVVSNFNLPNSNLNKNGSYLQILEQPQTKFRFRYKSEMVGTHGQLKAESSDKNRTVYPTVKLCNWKGGPALIRLMLYTAEDNANDRKKHVHELNGKNCNKEGFTGGCEVIVEEKTNYTAQFPNLGIIHIAKRDVQNIIYIRKKDDLINLARMNNPGLRNESIQHNVSPTELQQLKEAADEEAKAMDLNKVVLRFQAYFYDSKEQCYRPITDYVDSEVIFNLKNASTGELKIVRISSACAPCSGGSEIWMLVEKVKKSNVRIKFYELNQDNVEVWKGYGEFKESDVHHQYAIVFRTPPYRYTNIREPVHLKVILERTTDHDTSEPLDFTFTPEKLKRSNAFLETHMDSEINPQKRIRPSLMEPMDLKTNNNLFLGSREIKQPYSPETPYQSPSHMVPVPSPVASADSPLSQGFYSPVHHGSVQNPAITVSKIEDKHQFALDSNYSEQQQAGNPEYTSSPWYYYGVDGTPSSEYIPNIESGNFSNTFPNGNHTNIPNSPYHQVPSPSYHQQSSPYSNGNVPSPGNQVGAIFTDQNQCQDDTYLAQIQQFDAIQKQVNSSKTFAPNQFDFSDLVNSPNDLNINENFDLLDIITNEKFFAAAPKEFGDIQADCARPKPKDKVAANTSKLSSKSDVDTLTDKLSTVSVKDEKGETENKPPKEVTGKKDVAMTIAMTAAQKYLLSVQNSNGENSLNTAILNRDKNVFNKIIKLSVDLKCQNIFAAQNLEGETPLHVATRLGEVEMVQKLVSVPGCPLTAVDCDGNTAIHLAAAHSSSNCLSAILAHPVNGTTVPSKHLINLYNYNGQTSLLIAVSAGCYESVRLLIQSGSFVHLCDRKQGANPLHLAVIFGMHKIVKYLIDNTNVTVDAGLLSHNTALHIAAQARDKEMCAILMAAMANPHAKNSIRKGRKQIEKDNFETNDDESSSDEADDAADFYTPIDYAGDDEEILSILTGKQSRAKEEKIPTS